MKFNKKGSGAPARGKKGKSAPGLTYEEASRLKFSIDKGELNREDLFRFLGALQHACDLYDKSCKGKRDNPNCLCGLIPAPGSSRRKGLWQKDPECLVSLGANPADRKRQVPLPSPSPWNHFQVLLS
jgi:ubiquitin carboxyl-terminal hydrolase 48